MNLILREDGGGPRHYVDGRPVHCGTYLEMQLGGERGPWVIVRYEASLSRHARPVVTLFAVGGRIYPDEDATFRWPQAKGGA